MSEVNDTITITNTSGYPGLNNDPLLKVIYSLNLDAKLKKMEMERLHLIVKKDKHKYNNELQKYNSINKDIIETEEKIEDIQRQMSKNKVKTLMFYSQLTNTFYNQIIENCNQNNSLFIFYLFSFCGFGNLNHSLSKKHINNPEYVFLFNSVITNEDELASLIHDGEIFQKNLCQDDYGTFAELRNKIKILTTDKNIPYPFEPIFSHMLTIYDCLNLESKQKKIEIEKNNHVQYKNAIFLGLKVLENNIVQSDSLYHDLDNYIKGVQGLMDKYNNMKQINTKSAYEKLKNVIKDFQSANWKIGNELDKDLLQITSVADLDFCEHNMAMKGEFSEDSYDNSSTGNVNNKNKLLIPHIKNINVKNEDGEETCENLITVSGEGEVEEEEEEEDDEDNRTIEKEISTPKTPNKCIKTKILSPTFSVCKSPKAITPILLKSQLLLPINKGQKIQNTSPSSSSRKNILTTQEPSSLFNKYFYMNYNKNSNITVKPKKYNNSKLNQTALTTKNSDRLNSKSPSFIMNISSNKKAKQTNKNIKKNFSKKSDKCKNYFSLNKAASSIIQHTVPTKTNFNSSNAYIDVISNITDLTSGGITFEHFDNESVCEELSPMHKSRMNPTRLFLRGPNQTSIYPLINKDHFCEQTNLQIENHVNTPGCCMSCT